MSNTGRMINQLPAPTFRWLQMNGAVVEKTAGDPRALSFDIKTGEAKTEILDLKDQTADLLEQTTEIHVAKDASFHLIEVQRLGKDTEFLNQVKVQLEDGAKFDYTRLILSGAKTWEGLDCKLEGRKSSLNINLGYLLTGEEELDVNYLASHTGKKTNSEINVNGVLRGHAKKLFRGTIDFIRGCSGAVGNEIEDVLLMDDTVRNQTIPLILCAEEDVVGNHGATIGRLPEELVFYMGSRGLAKDEIYETMARAKIGKLLRLFPEGSLKEELTALLYGVSDEE